MKTIKSITIILISFFIIQSSFGQRTVKKQTIKVYGECGQCKKKIEKSAMSAGAAYASWNEETKLLDVSYNPSVSNPVKIETAIAGAGYDTQDVPATDSAYNKLDKCCQYDRKSLTSKSN
jgi:mercuric ion binding protein